MKQQTTSPTISKKLTEIIVLVLKFRFLNRVQIQTLLHHKSHSRIVVWLKELTETKYLKQYYDKQFAGIPAVYSLGTVGRTYLKEHPEIAKSANLLSIDRVWKEKENTPQFRTRCQFAADIYLSLLALTNKSKAEVHFSSQSDLYGMDYMILDYPDAYFAIVEKDKTVKRYFLEVFEDVRPSILRGRVRQYFNYYDHNYWQDQTKKSFPEIILVFPTVTLKNHLYYVICSKLERYPELKFYLTTRNLIQNKGMCRDALQKVEVPD